MLLPCNILSRSSLIYHSLSISSYIWISRIVSH
nr:MAG TPA: hypothetical protein [Caudoviricetes sp.]